MAGLPGSTVDMGILGASTRLTAGLTLWKQVGERGARGTVGAGGGAMRGLLSPLGRDGLRMGCRVPNALACCRGRGSKCASMPVIVLDRVPRARWDPA